MKDFDTWNVQKKEIQTKEEIPYFYEKEMWFVSLGANIGYEQDGKGNEFARPVVIIKKCNAYCFLGVPLTTQTKEGKYYYTFEFQGNSSTAILSQIKLFSSQRLLDNKGKIDTYSFKELKKKIRELFY